MYTKQPKKLIIMNILEILRKYTDENHRLSQKEIVDLLKRDYDMTVERKSIRRNINDLIDFGFEIEYKSSGENEESQKMTDLYLVRDFADAELRLLIDGLLFSKNIPNKQCKELITKIEGLSNVYFRSRMNHVHAIADDMPQNKQLFYTIEVLDEAISNQKQVSFFYNEYSTDKKLHPRVTDDGKERVYTMNPYAIAATNGRYYLICNNDKYDTVSNYRLDRITGIKMLNTPIKPMKEVKGLENGFDLPKHMAEHIYMYSGESAVVNFSFDKRILNDLFDWFGNDITFLGEDGEYLNASVRVNLEAMRKWALQYSLYVKVNSPGSLAENIKEDLKKACSNYGI